MKKLFTTFGLVPIGAALCAAGIYVGETDDAPGAAIIGIVLMIVALTFAVKIARRKDPASASGPRSL